MSLEAKSVGIATVVWSYPRGGNLSKEGETAIDITAYAAQLAAQIGANIIKVKPPTDYIEQDEARRSTSPRRSTSRRCQARIAHVMQSAFNGRRLVVFSGGAAKDLDGVLHEICRDLRRRRHRLDHRPQHLPAAARRRARHARHHHQDLPGQGLEPHAGPTAACRLYLITPPELDPDALRGRRWRGASTPAMSPACSFALKDIDDDDDPPGARPAAAPSCQERDVAFIMNGRPDLVAGDRRRRRACRPGMRADEAARARLGEGAILGATCKQSRHAAMIAAEQGADYVAFGAFFESRPSRPRPRHDARGAGNSALVERADGGALRRHRRHHGGELPAAGDRRGRFPGRHRGGLEPSRRRGGRGRSLQSRHSTTLPALPEASADRYNRAAANNP